VIDLGWTAAVLAATAVACTISASAGLGGSLVLVPALAALVGAKEGVALAALLLAVGNVGKVVAYRHTLPVRLALPMALAVAVGAALGASLLVAVSEEVVVAAVVAMLAASLLAEVAGVGRLRRASAPLLALVSGATSGFSGTSGPLKGVALRNLALERRCLVGAASIVSMVGDLTKTAVYTDAGLLGAREVAVAAAAVPVMFLAVRAGRSLNERVGERRFALLFWSVMAGYGVRVLWV
jgi:uncharacterized protein